jgi:hypothetical protein
MLGNNLSNVVEPVAVLVFEGLVGILPEHKVSEYEEALSNKDWKKVVSCFRINTALVNRLIQLTRNGKYNFSVVTWLPGETVPRIIDVLDKHMVPVRDVFASKPEDFAASLAFHPEIAVVYDNVTQHAYTYGSKGRLVINLSDIGK